MLPLHLLIQNLLYDVSRGDPFDNVDEEQIKSRSAKLADLGRFMVFFQPISSADFRHLTFCLMWWVFHF